MFKKILIANRGEIAVRAVRACRDLDIWTVALFDASDRDSLHVRLADECVQITSPLGYLDVQQIVELALKTEADAIYPGYGFLAERKDFAAACEAAGIVFIGPPSHVLTAFSNKIDMLEAVAAAGLAIPLHSSVSFRPHEEDIFQAEAEDIGYPLVIKSCSGGRGRASRIIYRPEDLHRGVREAAAEAQMVFGSDDLYYEHMIRHATFLDVQVLADQYGNMVHLGERDGSIQRNNQKLVTEGPAPDLTPAQRARLHEMALQIARLFNYVNAGTIEFLMDDAGQIYFTEVKCRIQVEHPVTEMTTRRDLVREQIRIASGERLGITQEDVRIHGTAMQCRITAEDPWNNFMPSPGFLRRFRLPGGPYVRVDSYAYSGCTVSARYDPMIAKLVVWGETRNDCMQRMRRALQDFAIAGIQTNLPLFQRILDDPDFIEGRYDTGFLQRSLTEAKPEVGDELLQDLAVIAAVAYQIRLQSQQPVTPDRLLQGWHRSGRQLSG
ncbi:MAG: ATP-grasp domain-containing protein [Caldilineae bacterium]|nr:ATP-grasp domain-containing protein [Anaerolineae bacterium]MCB9143593.1 ATP-grasp domain-containing protein [Anaerolineales bacterium]MCB9155148.1 ATP-grasp domain-containing protein [Caldilineae bacterium]MCB0198661.1 ATP-grasp domain-containing protein [Anaerolineae bacterium]MCB0204389.1 ATP-grasp domain-containing protein [Anaerolineae bacterium]